MRQYSLFTDISYVKCVSSLNEILYETNWEMVCVDYDLFALTFVLIELWKDSNSYFKYDKETTPMTHLGGRANLF